MSLEPSITPDNPNGPAANGGGSSPGPRKPPGRGIVTGVLLLAVAVVLGVIALRNAQERRAARGERVRRQIEFAKDRGTPAPGTTDLVTATVADLRPRFALTNIPDFSFTNEFGRPVSLRDFPGQAVAFTFFFTRCGTPEYCPRLTKNFSAACEKLAARPDSPTNWHLFSISFDPKDTPGHLLAYARGNHYHSNHWSFLTGPSEQTIEMALGFGVKVTPQAATLSHGFSTVIFDAGGGLQASWPISGDTSDALVTELIKGATQH